MVRPGQRMAHKGRGGRDAKGVEKLRVRAPRSRELSKRRVEATAVIERRGRWYVATVVEIPGINVQERTLSAVRESLKSALRELSEIAPEQLFAKSRRIESVTVLV